MDGLTYTKHELDISMVLRAEHIMQMAIHGLAISCKMPEQGLPAKPDKKAILPFFIRLFHCPDWEEVMMDLVKCGWQHDQVDSDVQEALERGFIDPGMLYLFIEEIAEMAGR